VTTIEESKDLEEMKIGELVGSLQTYEYSLPPVRKAKTIALKALDVISFSISMFLLFFYFIVFNIKNKNKNWGRRCKILFFSFDSFQILYVFLPDISVHCALIDFA